MSNQLLMYLLGVGGTGKSKVISCVYKFIRNICHHFNWPFDNNTIKICAMSGAAASLLESGLTLHGAAHLNTSWKNITDEDRELWKSTKLLIIDEVSFMNENESEQKITVFDWSN